MRKIIRFRISKFVNTKYDFGILFTHYRSELKLVPVCGSVGGMLKKRLFKCNSLSNDLYWQFITF